MAADRTRDYYDRRLRLRGQGMPNPRGTPGDLYAEVKVMVPATVTDAERELYERLSRGAAGSMSSGSSTWCGSGGGCER